MFFDVFVIIGHQGKDGDLGAGLTGQGGGKMAPVCDVLVCAPARRTPEIQEYHLAIYHALCAALEQEFFSV